MSITTPVGGMNHFFRKVRISKRYVSSKNKYKKVMKKNKFLQKIYRFTSKTKDVIMNAIYSQNLFEDLGLYYYGVVDGHNIKKITKAINQVKDVKGPVILHLKTKKGKGYKFAEEDVLGEYHSVPPFNKDTGEIYKSNDNKVSFSKIYSELLDKQMEIDRKIISINPAMSYGSSLNNLMKKYPQRALDVGISEEHALVYASGMAINSYHPYVSIYSTFLQRSYDQISHEISRMDLPVTLLVDHCGLVGKDGETHQGIYDYGYLSSVPNMTIVMAKDESEAKKIFNFSLNYNHPLAIRYPVCTVNRKDDSNLNLLKYGQWDILSESENKETCVITFGPKIDEILNLGLNITLVNAIFNYPLNTEVLASLLDYKNIVIYDPYGTVNGFANHVSLKLLELGYKGEILKVCLPLEFIKKGTIEEQEIRYQVDINSLIKLINKYGNY
jgi:1-deoxy-D-xylulose-5-phosphate synthase